MATDEAGEKTEQPTERRRARAREQGNVAKSVDLTAAGLLLGGQAFINPLLREAAVRRETHRMGDIVFSMRGGLLCRHLSFDNKTAAITEGAVMPCESDLSKENTAAAKGFAWGAH